jgi:hypothetical protein
VAFQTGSEVMLLSHPEAERHLERLRGILASVHIKGNICVNG